MTILFAFFITLISTYYFKLHFSSSKYFSFCLIIPGHGFNEQIKDILNANSQISFLRKKYKVIYFLYNTDITQYHSHNFTGFYGKFTGFF